MRKTIIGLVLLKLASCGASNEMQDLIVGDCSGLHVRTGNVDRKICNKTKRSSNKHNKNGVINYRQVKNCENTLSLVFHHTCSETIFIKQELL